MLAVSSSTKTKQYTHPPPISWGIKDLFRLRAFRLLGRGGLGFALFLLVHAVFAAVPLNPSGGVDQFLAAGEKRVAIGADFNLEILDRGAGFDHIATGARNRGVEILGMNFLFHFFILYQQIIILKPIQTIIITHKFHRGKENQEVVARHDTGLLRAVRSAADCLLRQVLGFAPAKVRPDASKEP